MTESEIFISPEHLKQHFEDAETRIRAIRLRLEEKYGEKFIWNDLAGEIEKKLNEKKSMADIIGDINYGYGYMEEDDIVSAVSTIIIEKKQLVREAKEYDRHESE